MPSKKPARSLAVVVLAAGRGKRLKSGVPKVLHLVCGRPALWHVLRAAAAVKPDRLVVVVHHGGDRVEEAVRSWKLRPSPVFVDQGEPLGTGHAVAAATRDIGDAVDVLVLAGDDPLVEGSHLRALMAAHRRSKAAATILTTEVRDPTGYGRVLKEGNRLAGIVQEADASASQRRIREISTLSYAFQREHLLRALPKVGRENSLGEYYLPDVLAILLDTGEKVVVEAADLGGGLGVNSRRGLAEANAIMRERINAAHMDKGVTLVDPSQTYIDVEVRIAPDATILPLTFLQGDTRVESGSVIGPSASLKDTRVGRDAVVEFSVVDGARIGPRATVGPFARVRPGTVIGEEAKVGTFVEVKGSSIGRGSKVPHLSYVGDADIGADVNVGAATITVNWDGYAKHSTRIGDRARIGSDTMLVAPVRVGKGGVTGAGSVITRDVPAGALGVERAEQRNVPGYRKRKDAEAVKGNRRAKAASKSAAKSTRSKSTRSKSTGSKSTGKRRRTGG